MESGRKDVEELERERRDRERRERESGKDKRTSTLHRESDFTLECPDGRISPLPRPFSTPVSCGESSRNKTDMAVRYGASRGNGDAARVRGVARQTGPMLGEFERRLLNAKRLGKAPMPSVDEIP